MAPQPCIEVTFDDLCKDLQRWMDQVVGQHRTLIVRHEYRWNPTAPVEKVDVVIRRPAAGECRKRGGDIDLS